MESKHEKALNGFHSGLNCAQAVLSAYTEAYKIDNSIALSIATGFGGGMGRLQETCGAVTGAFMVLGVHNCKKYSDNADRKANTYSMIQEFDRKFKAIHGTSSCKSLLGVDLRTEEGQKILKEKNLHDIVCDKCISDAINIVEELTA